ncbi:MAG: glycoside hydrolase family 15 protein, partial [Thermoanaerobaculia bacterium]|nr:glycoside hydrolase family 15 protein [Thermoanaerobaculia bacterium]
MTETGSPRYIPIEDYGIIGDTCSAALVSRSGSIDWLAWPRFDSPSIFARLLDSDRGGFFSIAPVEPFESERHYLEDTNVLVTTFTTASGRFTVTDLMPAFPELTTERLTPFRSIIRRIEGVEGTVAIEMIYDPRIGYGQKSTRLSSRGNSTIFCARGQDALYLRSTAPLQLDGSRECARAKLRVARGETVDFSLAYNDIAPAVLPPLEEAATEEIDATIDYWESWADRINYDGPFSNMVRRSALTLKLLCYSPSGAVIAAPTTSLPEWIGGDRNWDYRFCWLRDASFTVRSLYDLHCQREAESYVGWLLHATRLSHPRLRVLYDVYGETRLHESEVDLDGYRSSRPVRTGNGAHAQKQLDVYGEVMGALMHHVEEGHELQRTERRFAEGLADYVADHWCEADDGIWEERAPRRQHVHAKVRCWAALVNA